MKLLFKLTEVVFKVNTQKRHDTLTTSDGTTGNIVKQKT
jgi:hypothetical protein